MKRLVVGCWCRDGDGDGGNHAVKVTGDQYLEGGKEVSGFVSSDDLFAGD